MSHVPDPHLPEYRRLRDAAEAYDTLGNRLSGLGFYAEANEAWGKEAQFKRQAQGLRNDPR